MKKMVERIKAWHEVFIQGINLKMIGLAIAGLVSASFFVRGKFDDIMAGQITISHKVDTMYYRLDNKVENLRRDTKDINRDMRHYVDSQFNDLWNVMNNKNIVPSKRILHLQGDGCVIQKIINGRREYVPIDCNSNQQE